MLHQNVIIFDHDDTNSTKSSKENILPDTSVPESNQNKKRPREKDDQVYLADFDTDKWDTPFEYRSRVYLQHFYSPNENPINMSESLSDTFDEQGFLLSTWYLFLDRERFPHRFTRHSAVYLMFEVFDQTA